MRINKKIHEITFKLYKNKWIVVERLKYNVNINISTNKNNYTRNSLLFFSRLYLRRLIIEDKNLNENYNGDPLLNIFFIYKCFNSHHYGIRL